MKLKDLWNQQLNILSSVFDEDFFGYVNQLKENIIQPAFNSSQHINEHRFNGEGNIQNLVNFANNNKLSTMPHTPKDYKYFSNYVIDQNNLREMLKFEYTSEFVKVYLNFDSVIAFRGHGQLISIGLNIPGLYFSTQDKVKYFSLNNGFKEYNIDINDKDWNSQLLSKYSKLLMDSTYRNKWYEIRDNNISKWHLEFKNFISKCN